MTDRRNFFDQSINNIIKTYENIRKIATGKGDDYTTGCLLDYCDFKENYKITAVDLSKQQALDADPRAIQQIEIEIKQFFLLLNKQNKLFLNFHKDL